MTTSCVVIADATIESMDDEIENDDHNHGTNCLNRHMLQVEMAEKLEMGRRPLTEY
jgi:hypothetical protein